MFYVSMERRSLSSAFDSFVESTDKALRNPLVATKLGSLTSELLRINQTVFLPNLKDGAFHIPSSQKNSDNVALVPLTNQQADQTDVVMAPMTDDRQVRYFTPEQSTQSITYGLNMTLSEIDSFFDAVPAPEASGETSDSNNPPPKQYINAEYRPNTLAKTSTTVHRYKGVKDPGFREYSVSRPLITVRRSILSEGDAICGSLVAHEYVHALDAVTDGPMYLTQKHDVASESRGYHITAVVLRAFGIDTPMARSFIELDDFRASQVSDARYPFLPNQPTTDRLISDGRVAS